MTSQDQVVLSFRRQLASLLTCRQAVALATVFLFIWGSGVLGLRAALGAPREPLLWGLLGLVPCVGLAYWLARRKLPHETAVRALLDRTSHSGGLLMAGAEKDLGRWEWLMPEVREPRLRWDASRAAGYLVVAVGFALVAFFLPDRLTDFGNDPALDVGPATERLAKQVEVLKEEKIIEAKRADDLKGKLEQVREDAKGKDPAKTLEALDHVENLTQKAAREAAEDAIRKTEELTQNENLTDALRKAGAKDIAPKVEAEAMAQLAVLTRKAAKENAQLDKQLDLDPELAKALDKGELSKEDLKKLSDALKDCKGELSKKLGRLHKAKLVDAKALKKCSECGEGKSEELLAYLKECRGGS